MFNRAKMNPGNQFERLEKHKAKYIIPDRPIRIRAITIAPITIKTCIYFEVQHYAVYLVHFVSWRYGG